MNVKFGMNVIKIVRIQLDHMYVLVEQIIHLKQAIDANILIVNFVFF